MRFNPIKAATILYLCPVIKNKANMKKINIITIALLIYLVVMAIIGWPGSEPENGYLTYFLTIGATLVVILLLRYLQIKRMKSRQKWNEENRPGKSGK